MAKLKLSYPECLQVIENFGVLTAQSIVGGKVTEPNHPRGDLYRESSDTFFEVKASGLSAGAIIREDQLARQHVNATSRTHQHVIVFYENRGNYEGKYCCLPVRIATNRRVLEYFLATRIKEVWVVDTNVVQAIFQSRLAELRTYDMQGGPKTYLKISRANLHKLTQDTSSFANLGLPADQYTVRHHRRMAKFRWYRKPVTVSEVVKKSAS